MFTDEYVKDLLLELAHGGGFDECQAILKTALDEAYKAGQKDVFTRGSMKVE